MKQQMMFVMSILIVQQQLLGQEPKPAGQQPLPMTPPQLLVVPQKSDSAMRGGLSGRHLPNQVAVMPIFIVPQGELKPSQEQTSALMRHVAWTQTRYLELIHNKGTFYLAADQPKIYMAQHPLSFYRESPEGAAPQFVSELLADLRCNRYTCPYILLSVVINPHDGFPVGGGRPLNGGLNTGGGVVELSSYDLDHSPNFQSTLQHELGHSFGLVHVDCYGYDMNNNSSIMSYNPKHHTDGFTASSTPGIFLPEDLRGLASNKRVFGKFQFDPSKDIPKGYSIKNIVSLGPMNIPGQEQYKASGESGKHGD